MLHWAFALSRGLHPFTLVSFDALLVRKVRSITASLATRSFSLMDAHCDTNCLCTVLNIKIMLRHSHVFLVAIKAGNLNSHSYGFADRCITGFYQPCICECRDLHPNRNLGKVASCFLEHIRYGNDGIWTRNIPVSPSGTQCFSQHIRVLSKHEISVVSQWYWAQCASW